MITELVKQAADHYIARIMSYAVEKGLIDVSYPIASEHDTDHPFPMAHFNQAYRVHPWIYSCVRVIATSASHVPLKLFREIKTGDKITNEPIPGHELAAVFQRPNPHTSQQQLMYATAAYLKINGNHYWWLVRGGGGRVEMIIPIRPDRMKVIVEHDGEVVGYTYTVDGSSNRLEFDEVIHFKEFNPYNDHYGMPPLEAARRTLIDDVEAREYNTNLLRNSAVPRGALVTEQKISDRDFERLKVEWEAAHKGALNANRVAILEKGLSFQNIGMSQKDMDFIDKLKMNRNEFGSIFGVPPSKLNDTENQPYANAIVQERDFWHDTVIPTLSNVTDTINLNMWKLHGRAFNTLEPIKVDSDLSNVLALRRESLDLAEADRENVAAGLRTINEIRERDNLEPTEYGDVWWRQGALMPTTTPADVTTPGNIAAMGHRIIAPPLPFITLASKADEYLAFAIQQDHFEKLVTAFVDKLFADQRRIVLRNFERLVAIGRVSAKPITVKLTQSEVDALLFNIRSAKSLTEAAYRPVVRRMVKAGGQRGIELASVPGAFDVRAPDAVAFMKTKAQTFATHINETTWNELRVSLGNGLKEGENSLSLAKRVDRIFKGRRANAATIAQTETTSALNGGVMKGFKQSKVVETKTWLIAGDGLERKDHADAVSNNQDVPLDSPFQVGGELLDFPGDPNASAAQVVNCRCTISPGVRKD